MISPLPDAKIIPFIPAKHLGDKIMGRAAHYSPAVDRQIVCALYYEAKFRHKPMTRLVNELLSAALQGTHGWQRAFDQQRSIIQEQPTEPNRPAR